MAIKLKTIEVLKHDKTVLETARSIGKIISWLDLPKLCSQAGCLYLGPAFFQGCELCHPYLTKYLLKTTYIPWT